MEEIVKQRITELILKRGISVSSLSKEIGIPQNTLSRQINGSTAVPTSTILSILGYFKTISADWILGFSDKMEKDTITAPTSGMQVIHHPKSIEKVIDEQLVTLYDVDAAANLKTLFDNKDQHILGEIKIPHMPKCDGAVYVKGDSMYPLLKSGDIIMYKEVQMFENVIFGEMYLVSMEIEGDEYLAVKYVNKSDEKDCIKLVSYNTHHEPKDVKIENIRAMALVKVSIRMNTMR